jgi:hypothetical protein
MSLLPERESTEGRGTDHSIELSRSRVSQPKDLGTHGFIELIRSDLG